MALPTRRRRFLAGVASAGAVGAAGCLGGDGDGDGNGDDGDDGGDDGGDDENGDDGDENGDEVENLTATATTEYSVELEWKPPAAFDADRYDVYVDRDEPYYPWNDDTELFWDLVESMPHEVHGLAPGTTYEFLVVPATDEDEFSESSASVEVTTDGDPPDENGPPTHEAVGNPVYGQWTQTVIGAGGKNTGIATTPADPNVVYARSDATDTLRSDDKGEHWYMIREGWPARGFSVDPRDEDTIVVAETDGLYYSDRVGANYREEDLDVEDVWEQVLDARFPNHNGTFREFGTVVARHPDDPDVLIATPEDEPFHRSTDGGESWEPIEETPENLHPTHVVYHPDDPETVFVCAQAQDRTVNRAFDPGLYRSTDGGDTWEQLLDDPADPPLELAFDPETGAVYGLFGQEGGNAGENELRRSTDGGESWESWADGLAIDGDVASIDVNHHDDHVYAIRGGAPGYGDDGFIFRLPPGGEEWEEYARVWPEHVDESYWWDDVGGSPDWDGTASLAFDRQDPRKWYLAATYALYTSQDAGERWRYASRGLENLVFMDLEPDPDPDSDLVHAGIADFQYFRLENDGTQLEFIREPDIHNVRRVETSPDDPDRVWATSGNYAIPGEVGGLAYSDDRGETWNRIEGDQAGFPALDLASEFRWYEHGYGTASPVASGLSVDPEDADHLVIGLGGTYGHYTDNWWGGFPDEELADVDPDDPVGVYRSTDGGASFEPVPGTVAGHFHTGVFSWGNELALSADGSMVAAPGGGGPVQYWDPDAEEWYEADLPVAGDPGMVDAATDEPGRFVVALGESDEGPGGIVETVDGGETWELLLYESARRAAYDPQDADRIVVGEFDEYQTVAVTTAGSDVIVPMEPVLGMTPGSSLAISGDTVIAGTVTSSCFFADLGDVESVTETPAAPEALAADVDGRTVSLAWDGADGEHVASLVELVPDDGSDSTVLNVLGTETEIDWLAEGTYEVVVRAVNPHGDESDPSDAVTVDVGAE